ncbi:MAG: hypothetical protein AAGA48_03235, partial [Myxococcota bacterium]
MILSMLMLGTFEASAVTPASDAFVSLETESSPLLYVLGVTCLDLTIRGQENPGVRVRGDLDPELKVRLYPEKNATILAVEPKNGKNVTFGSVNWKVKRNGRTVVVKPSGVAPTETLAPCGSLLVEVPTEMALFLHDQELLLDGRIDQFKVTGTDLEVTSRAKAASLKFLALGALDVDFEQAPEVAQVTSYEGAVKLSGNGPQDLD